MTNEQSVLPAFGDVFSVIGVREPQAAASEAFVKFADAHRNIEKYGIQLLKTIKPVSIDWDWWVCLARTANCELLCGTSQHISGILLCRCSTI